MNDEFWGTTEKERNPGDHERGFGERNKKKGKENSRRISDD
jgi:hypothetical protein